MTSPDLSRSVATWSSVGVAHLAHSNRGVDARSLLQAWLGYFYFLSSSSNETAVWGWELSPSLCSQAHFSSKGFQSTLTWQIRRAIASWSLVLAQEQEGSRFSLASYYIFWKGLSRPLNFVGGWCLMQIKGKVLCSDLAVLCVHVMLWKNECTKSKAELKREPSLVVPAAAMLCWSVWR